MTVGDVSHTYLLASSDGRIAGSCGGSDGDAVAGPDAAWYYLPYVAAGATEQGTAR